MTKTDAVYLGLLALLVLYSLFAVAMSFRESLASLLNRLARRLGDTDGEYEHDEVAPDVTEEPPFPHGEPKS